MGILDSLLLLVIGGTAVAYVTNFAGFRSIISTILGIEFTCPPGQVKVMAHGDYGEYMCMAA